MTTVSVVMSFYFGETGACTGFPTDAPGIGVPDLSASGERESEDCGFRKIGPTGLPGDPKNCSLSSGWMLPVTALIATSKFFWWRSRVISAFTGSIHPELNEQFFGS